MQPTPVLFGAILFPAGLTWTTSENLGTKPWLMIEGNTMERHLNTVSPSVHVVANHSDGDEFFS